MIKAQLKYFTLLMAVMILAACKTETRQVTADLINFPPSEGSANSNQRLPVIEFDSTTMRFGTIAIGEKVTHSFKFKNSGKTPLLISQVTPSCGCTTPMDWPKEPILPGEAGQITVEFNSRGFTGVIEKNISVLTNCIPATYDLKIVGYVSGEEVDPVKYRYEMEMDVP
jgi:hypothetical protein